MTEPHTKEATVTVIHCWSAPRSRSTALLYSFESRSKSFPTAAIDEPLYRRWTAERADSVERPYASLLVNGGSEELANSNPEANQRWKEELKPLKDRLEDAARSIGGAGGVVFCKHMAKHSVWYDFEHETEWGEDSVEEEERPWRYVHKHVLLIRDPVAILSSWGAASANHGGSVASEEVGIVQLLSVYSAITSYSSSSSSSVVVLDSDQLAIDPAFALWRLCHDLGIDYHDCMLTWDAGPHTCDGPWADWWYADVHKSTGWFGHKPPTKPNPTPTTTNQTNNPPTYLPPTQTNKYRTLDPSLLPALKTSLPAHTFLHSLTHAQIHRSLAHPHRPASEHYEDPRNANVLVHIGPPGRGRILPRDFASVSPWDSSVQGGDAAWEGLRVYRGKILSLDKHLRRLFRSAKALGFENVHTREQVVEAIFRVLAANGMRDGAHMRLTLTRGEKYTSSMNPKFNVYGTTLIILPEWKPTEGATTYDNQKGITLITASTRRNSPSTCDSKIHHNNMINNILPKIQANLAGAADAIMLDMEGFVSETNATNIFMVDDNGTLLTPHEDHCLPGITRETVLTLAKELNIPTCVRRVSLAEFHAAEEVFTTGTMGELTPVTMIDGRVIGDGVRGPITERLQGVYKELPERPGWSTEIPSFVTNSIS